MTRPRRVVDGVCRCRTYGRVRHGDWQQAERDVARLRQRIFTASQAGDLAKVRSLQKLMLRSRSNALLSVRRVTELDAGHKTAGVDGVVLVTVPGKALLGDAVQHRSASWKPMPVKRFVVALRWPLLPVLHQLHVAERAGWVAAVLAFVAFFWPARFFAAIPAMGARVLVSEIYLQFAGRSVLESLEQGDRRRARVLYDLSIYSTRGTNRLGRVDAVMLRLGGIVLLGGALWARFSSASTWFVWGPR
ncbi:MAG: reverse transcriptase N-terminal domain-containing protein [Actinobacteria bacterium]|nr:reverse transcriptase N-terminal domain-containing protein [Actinomycetota bacterium]